MRLPLAPELCWRVAAHFAALVMHRLRGQSLGSEWTRGLSSVECREVKKRQTNICCSCRQGHSIVAFVARKCLCAFCVRVLFLFTSHLFLILPLSFSIVQFLFKMKFVTDAHASGAAVFIKQTVILAGNADLGRGPASSLHLAQNRALRGGNSIHYQ